MNRRPAEREYCVEHAALSDVGLCRSNNQDSLIVSPADSVQPGQAPGHLLVVADGMGAHAAGEVASQMAVEIVLRVYRNQANGKPADALRQAITTANSEIFARGAQSDELRGMGTTVSALLLLPDEAIIAHVGDSRVYRLRGNDLEQLTFDHSLVWEICDAENVMESEVPAFVPRNIITRSVGPTSEVAVDLEGPFSLRTGDVFLLCSDGLSGQVEDEEMGTILRCLDPEEAAKTLIALANLRGSPDNITLIVARVNRWQPAGAGRVSDHQASAPLARKVFWPMVTAAGLFALGWLLSGPLLAIPAAVVGAALAGLTAFVRNKRRAPLAAAPQERQRLGKAPYTACDCTLNEQSPRCLRKAVREIRDVAINRLWQMDWDQYERLTGRAELEASKGDYLASVRSYAETLRFMLDQLRRTLGPRE